MVHVAIYLLCWVFTLNSYFYSLYVDGAGFCPPYLALCSSYQLKMLPMTLRVSIFLELLCVFRCFSPLYLVLWDFRGGESSILISTLVSNYKSSLFFYIKSSKQEGVENSDVNLAPYPMARLALFWECRIHHVFLGPASTLTMSEEDWGFEKSDIKIRQQGTEFQQQNILEKTIITFQ